MARSIHGVVTDAGEAGAGSTRLVVGVAVWLSEWALGIFSISPVNLKVHLVPDRFHPNPHQTQRVKAPFTLQTEMLAC